VSPAAEPIRAAAAPDAAEAMSRFLPEGEIVLLAVKPSSWFVLLASGPVLGVLAVVAAAMFVGGRLVAPDFPPLRLGALILAAIALLRVMLASFQWLGRLYVLTNRRVMRIHGIMRVDIADLPLKDLMGIRKCQTAGEQMLGLGTLVFSSRDAAAKPIAWVALADGDTIRRQVEDAAAGAC
jgi:hypothetical protein